MSGNFSGPDSPWVNPRKGDEDGQPEKPDGSETAGEQSQPSQQPEQSGWESPSHDHDLDQGALDGELQNSLDQDVDMSGEPGDQTVQQPVVDQMTQEPTHPSMTQHPAGPTDGGQPNGWRDDQTTQQPGFGQGEAWSAGASDEGGGAGAAGTAGAAGAAGVASAAGGAAPGAGAWGGSGQPPTGEHGAVATQDTPPPGGKRPWYKRPLVLTLGIVGLIVILIAAIGIPLAINMGNVAKGDQLADDFNTALEAHNAAWTDEEIAKLSNVVVSPALQENADFYSQSAASMADLQARCDGVATAASTLATLSESPIPVLEEAAGADASAKYQEAQATSDGLADQRAAVDTLTTDGATAIATLDDFCAVFPQYNSILNAFGLAFTNVFLPTLTIPNGSNIDFGNDLILPCNEAAGCPNYADQAARIAYGDAIDASFTTFFGDLGAQAGSACFLPDFADVCVTMETEYGATSQAYGTAAETIRTEQPVITPGQSPFPNFFPQFQAATDQMGVADTNVNASWQAVDPNTAGDTASGWQARSLKAALAAYETTVTDAVAQLG